MTSPHREASSWLKAPQWVEWIGDECGIERADYLAAVDEVLATFPTDWVDDQARRILKLAPAEAEIRLHPLPSHRLSHHPIPLMLNGTYTGAEPLLDLVRLGRDLIATRSGLNRPTEFRKRLKEFAEFQSALFELEVLAHLQRAGASPRFLSPPGPDIEATLKAARVLVEAKHRSASDPTVFAMRVFAALPYGFSGWAGGLRITFKVKPSDHAVGAIVEGLQKAVEAPGTYDDVNMHVERDGSMASGTIQFDLGPRGYAEDLGWLVWGALKNKEDERQLTGRCDEATRCVIALDFQSLVYAVPEYADRVLRQQVAAMRQGVVDGCTRFLRKSKAVSGILTWWRRAADVRPADRMFYPAEVSLISLQHAEEEVTDPTKLEAALAKLFQVPCNNPF